MFIVWPIQKITLRAARRINELTIKSVAYEVGITPKQLSKYERNPEGTPIDVAIKLTHLYGIPFQSLFSNFGIHWDRYE